MADPARSTAARRSFGIGVVLSRVAILSGALVGAARLLFAAARTKVRAQIVHGRGLVAVGLHAIEAVLREFAKNHMSCRHVSIALAHPVGEAGTDPDPSGFRRDPDLDRGSATGIGGPARGFRDRAVRPEVEAHAVPAGDLAKRDEAAGALAAEHAQTVAAVPDDPAGRRLAAIALGPPRPAELLDRHGPPSALRSMRRLPDRALDADRRHRLRLEERRLLAARAPPVAGRGSLGLTASAGAPGGALRGWAGSSGDGTARLTAAVPTGVGTASAALRAVAFRGFGSAAVLGAGGVPSRAPASALRTFETDAR
ncbi:MAG: hypothetical protein NZ555_14870, partial [Geminicoccaceae bacterium]|nr:hypothetical protein [Geminicoccaceae bacterium]